MNLNHGDSAWLEAVVDAAEGLVQAHYGEASEAEEAKALQRLTRALFADDGSPIATPTEAR